MRTAWRFASAAFAFGVVAIGSTGCAREMVPPIQGHHSAALRATTAYTRLTSDDVTIASPVIANIAQPVPIDVPSIAQPAHIDIPSIAQPVRIDVPSIAYNIDRVPGELASLRRLLMYAALGILTCGLLNAALLLGILRALLRKPAPAVLPARETPSLVAQNKRCSCGTPISSRSRTGRCRRCALAHNRQLATASTGLRSLPPAS
jgi:hypothetical protein